MAQKNIGENERKGRDFSASAINGESDAQSLIDEIETNDREVDQKIAEMKAAGKFSSEIGDIGKKYHINGDDVYDAFEEACVNKNEDGSFTVADVDNLSKKLAEYHRSLQTFTDAYHGKKSGDNEADPEREKIGRKKEADTLKENEILRGIESELTTGQIRLKYCENTYRQIIESGMEIVLDEDMSERLNQFAKSMDYMQKTLDALVKIKDEIKNKFNSSDEISGGEVEEIYERLDKLGDNLKYLESWGVSISKRIEAKSKEQLDMLDKLVKLESQLQERKNKGKFRDEKTATLNDSLIEKINKLRAGVVRGAKLNGSEVAGLEDLAKKQILSPEEKGDVYAERMELYYKIRPRLQKENAEIEEMSDQLIWIGNRDKTAPPKMRELFSKAGKKIGDAIGLNNLLSRAVSLETNPPVDEIKEQLKEYEDTLPEARKLYNKLMPEIKLMKINSLRPKLMWAEGDIEKKKLNVEQRAMLEGWKSILKSGDVSLEELDVIADSLEEKIISPLKVAGEKESAAVRDKLVTAMRGREAEKKFEREGEEMNKAREKKFEPPKKKLKEQAGIKEESFGLDELGEAAPTKAEKTVLRKGVKEMMAESGVIEIDPQQIMDLLSDQEMKMLVFNVRKDAIERSDSNYNNFYQVLRDALNENIFKELKKEERDTMLKEVSSQTYIILRDAVKAETESQLLKAKSGEASRLAKAGKIGAKLLANVAMAAGIGVGAAMIIGSGGAAAAVAGVSIVAAREMNKRIAKSDVFQRAKARAGSLWERMTGGLFKKDKNQVDDDQVLKEVSEQIATKEKLAVILSNQIRENSSRDIIEQINFFAEQKQEAVKHPSPETSAKFENALDGVSKEFYKKALNYVSIEYGDKNLSDEELSRMAMTLTLTIGQNQRGDVAAASALSELEKKTKSPEERNWFLDKAEKFFKIRSGGIGAAVFGGGMAYAVAETSSIGRIVSGAIAGAGLGLMIEKKMRVGEGEKIKKIVDKIISETEKKLKGKESGLILDTDMKEAKKSAAYVRAQLDAGAFIDDDVLKNRAENFVSRINRLSLESMEEPYFDIEDLLKDVSERSRRLEKETKKNIERVAKLSKDKKALIFMAAGAVIGGGLGYLGSQLSQYLRAPAPKTITPAEHDIGVTGGSRSVVMPLEKTAPPETPLYPIPPETPLKPIHEGVGLSAHKADIDKALETATRKITEHGPAVPAVSTLSGKPMEVSELYSASIKDIEHPQPVFLTREENIELQRLTSGKAEGSAIFDFIERAHERGQIYEDANGNQYHADELDFTPEKNITNPYDAEGPKVGKGGVAEDLTEKVKTAPKQKIKNPYADEELLKKIKPTKAGSSAKLDSYEDVYGKSKIIPKVRNLDSVDDVYGKDIPAGMTPEEIKAIGASGDENILKGPAEGVGAHEPAEIEQIRFKGADKDIKTPIPEERPVEDFTGRGSAHSGESLSQDTAPAKSSGPSPDDLERERILKEIEERRQAEAVEEQDDLEVEEEAARNPEVTKIIAQREQSMASQLASPKARSAYNWLAEQADNKNLSEADSTAVKGLKDDFVKDMVGDRKIEPTLLRKITALQKKIGQ